VSSSKYDEKVNTYGVKCGGSLEMWEESGWIHKQDPYGWFMWYCRYCILLTTAIAVSYYICKIVAVLNTNFSCSCVTL
jgi:hypothetical protein